MDKNNEKNEKGDKGFESGKKRVGIVVSDKMDKTVVVKVERIKVHPKYKKRYTVFKKYKAHDEKNEFKAGDRVVIAETRPLSRDKRWIAIDKLEYKK